MTYKQIEASREARLWFSQVIVPVVGAAMIAMTNPDVKEYVSDKFEKTKEKVNSQFSKLKRSK